MTTPTIRDAYTAWSTIYDLDHNSTRDLDHIVVQQILGPNRYGTILELGCGTGKNSALLRQISQQHYAFDFSPGMLAQARSKPGLTEARFSLADLIGPWPIAPACADLITFNLVLEHIPDLNHIFREARRVLRPGGQVFLCELHPFKQYQGKQAVFQQGDQEIPVTAYLHHLSDFTQAAESAGFRLDHFAEWWVDADHTVPPRLASMRFSP
ncbi:MAG: class I SAM-dependent methyltransferase [Anaerolineae bacterium]|nr:class I SAM-dependent methyltransferase [Anaerolineae bacterium]